MTLEDEFKLQVGAYYGIQEMDEYSLKVYVLKELENYIKDYIKENPIKNYDYKLVAENIKDNMPLKTKLQDSLIILNRMNGSMELILLIKEKLKNIRD